MNRYKLIKKYPGSPELNSIVFLYDSGMCVPDYRIDDSGSWADDIKIIESHPEFWEKVEEKDYEILKLKCIFSSPTHSPGDIINHVEPIDCQNYYKMKSCFDIHSIKRLSDGEVFTVGNKVNYIGNQNYNTWEIVNFLISKETITAGSEDNQICEYISDIKHCKTPLFTTEDGVDVFKGDTCYRISLVDNYLHSKVSVTTAREQILPIPSYFKYFSNKELAQEHIDNNKPMYSKKDMLDFGRSVCSRFVSSTWQVEIFLDTWKPKNKINE